MRDKTALAIKGWAGRIGLHYGMTVTNKGRDGASVSTVRGENRILTQINSVKNKKYDYIILHGGVNDAMDSAVVGNMVEDSFEISDFNTATFAGGLEELFYYAKEYFGEDAKYGYIINFKTPKSGWGGATRNMKRYVDITIKICEKWNIPYLDLYNDDDFNDNIMKVSTGENLNEFTENNIADYLHPNTSGYDVLYPVIGEWMENLGVKTVSEAESEIVSVDVSNDENSVSEKKTDSLIWIFGSIAVVLIIAVAAYIILRKTKK